MNLVHIRFGNTLSSQNFIGRVRRNANFRKGGRPVRAMSKLPRDPKIPLRI